MEIHKFEIIETIILLIGYIILRVAIFKAIDKASDKFNYQIPRVKIVKKLVQVLLVISFFGILLFVWQVDRSELTLFISSVLTILGIAFFAQWSIISNLTSTLIIFFNHPAKIGDRITIYDKDYPIHGVISDIGMFFVIIKTKEGQQISIPCNVFIQKMITKEEEA